MRVIIVTIKHHCDCCEKEIPIIKKKDILGIEREYLDTRESEWFVPPVLLCRTCSLMIENEILKIKNQILRGLL